MQTHLFLSGSLLLHHKQPSFFLVFRRLSYCNSAQDFTLRFTNLPQAPLTTLLIFHSAAVQGPWTEDLDSGAPVRSTAASQGPQCQPRAANSQPKSWQGWCFQPTWHRPGALLTTGDPSRALEAVTKMSLSLVCYSCAVTQLPGRERYLLVLSARVQPYKTVCPIPVGILHSQGCPTQHLPQGACAGSPPHGEEHLQPFVPTLTAGRSVPEGARADGRDGEGGRSRPEGSQSRGQRLGPRPALGGGSALQHGGSAPGAAPARPHGPGTRAGPALPPPRPPGKEPPLLRDLLAELRPRPLAWGAAGSSRPAGGVRRIPGRGGGESRECREYESGPGAAVRPCPPPPAAATPPFSGVRAAAAASVPRPAVRPPRGERSGRGAGAGLRAVARRGRAPLPEPLPERRAGPSAAAARGLPSALAARRTAPVSGVPEAAAPVCAGTCCRVLEEQTEGFSRG